MKAFVSAAQRHQTNIITVVIAAAAATTAATVVAIAVVKANHCRSIARQALS